MLRIKPREKPQYISGIIKLKGGRPCPFPSEVGGPSPDRKEVKQLINDNIHDVGSINFTTSSYFYIFKK